MKRKMESSVRDGVAADRDTAVSSLVCKWSNRQRSAYSMKDRERGLTGARAVRDEPALVDHASTVGISRVTTGSTTAMTGDSVSRLGESSVTSFV